MDASMPMVFEQNTKTAGSMARFKEDSFAGANRGGIDGSAPNYTQVNQNTFANKLKPRDKSIEQYSDNSQNSRSHASNDHGRSGNSNDDSSSDLDDSEENLYDYEAANEYDQ